MILTKLAELTVSDEKRSQGTQTLQCFIAMLLCSLLIEWSIWCSGIARADILCLPDEVLKQIAFVLGEEEDLGLLNNVAEILGKYLSVF